MKIGSASTIAITALALALSVSAGEVVTKNSQKLTLSGYTQARFVYSDIDDSSLVNNSIFVKRSRLKLAATVSEKTSVTVQLDFASSALLKDAYITFKPGSVVSFTAGQFKRPFSAEELTSSSKTFVINRGKTDSVIVELGYGGRDQGFMLTAQNNQRTFSLNVGVFSGAGEKAVSKGDNLLSGQTELRNRAKDFVGRLEFRPFLSGGKITLGANASFRVAGASFVDIIFVDIISTHGSQSFSSFGGDAALTLDNGLKFHFEALSGEDFSNFIDEQAPITAPKFFGGHFAASYHVKRINASTITAIQPELRFEIFDPDTDFGNDWVSLLSGGISLFFGNEVRWRNNVESVSYQNSATNSELQFTSELQGMF